MRFDDDNLDEGMGEHLIRLQYVAVIYILSQYTRMNFAANV